MGNDLFNLSWVSLSLNSILKKSLSNLLPFYRYAGINATDINYVAGRYGNVTTLPFDVGLEVGVIHMLYIMFKLKLHVRTRCVTRQ